MFYRKKGEHKRMRREKLNNKMSTMMMVMILSVKELLLLIENINDKNYGLKTMLIEKMCLLFSNRPKLKIWWLLLICDSNKIFNEKDNHNTNMMVTMKMMIKA